MRCSYSSLEPKQSGDVILYYHEGENEVARNNGWPDKVSLGQAAMHTIDPRHSILPENEDGDRSATLTPREMRAGLDYVQGGELSAEPEQPGPGPEFISPSLPKPRELRDDLPLDTATSKALEARLDELVDKENRSFFDAWERLATEFPELFKPGGDD